MVETTIVRPVANGVGEASTSGVTWSAIIAGAVAAAAIGLILLVLGMGIGLTAVSPWALSGVSGTTLGVGAVIWLVVTQWISAGFGGYLTGRLRTKWVNVHTHEVFFRDTAHGFLAWALATVFSAALLASVVSSLVSGATTAATSILSGAAQGAAQGLTQSAGPASDPTAYFVDFLFRTDKPPTTGTLQDIRSEGSRILLKALGEGDITLADKTRLAQLVAAQTGLSQADAEKRIDDVLAQAKAAAEKIKQAADTARKAVASAALFSFLSLLIGAFIASVAAALGGHERDEHERLHAVETVRID
jgi:hypothetical protein